MEQATQELDVTQYRAIKYGLHSTYKWGEGWHLSPEDKIEYYNLCELIAISFGLEIIVDKVSVDTCVSATNDKGEYLYFHPMDISGTIHKDNLQKLTDTILNIQDQRLFSLNLNNIRVWEIQLGLQPYQSGYDDNPNVRLSMYYPKTKKK